MLHCYFYFFLISKDTSSELVLFIAIQTKPVRNSKHGVLDLCRNLNSLCYCEPGWFNFPILPFLRIIQPSSQTLKSPSPTHRQSRPEHNHALHCLWRVPLWSNDHQRNPEKLQSVPWMLARWHFRNAEVFWRHHWSPAHVVPLTLTGAPIPEQFVLARKGDLLFQLCSWMSPEQLCSKSQGPWPRSPGEQTAASKWQCLASFDWIIE